jgi:ATP-dependent DNA helicase RecG
MNRPEKKKGKARELARTSSTGRKDGCLSLSDPVTCVHGVGPRTERVLRGRSIETIEDLLLFMPSRYEDRRQIRKICDLVEGEENTFLGRIVDSGQGYSRTTRKRTYRAKVDDGSGSVVLKWFRFNRLAMAALCTNGNLLFLSGKVSRFGQDLQITHPRVTALGEEDNPESLAIILPVYPETDGITQGGLRKIMRKAFAALRPDSFASLIPATLAARFQLSDFGEALRYCHFPNDLVDQREEWSAICGRVILEEFFTFQTAFMLKRRENQAGGAVMKAGRTYSQLRGGIPFVLTSGQEKVVSEIERDMASGQSMNRLLQGDVGSGKTICALLAAAIALDGGYQVAFLVPTEILAEQHYLSLKTLLPEVDTPHVLMTGGMSGSDRQKATKVIQTGAPVIVVGTHALFREDVKFPRLGLVIVDEQHRFGVIQRNVLRQKGDCPHVLVMTATPIPRSLSMVMYGDLDISIIEGMPPGRQKCITKVVSDEKRTTIENAIITETAKGHQVYTIYPLIEESGDELRSAKEGAKQLQELLPSLRVGLLHGRMTAGEKQETMVAFREGRLDVLVSTTVVEVGIDIPNATLMVIEHAERFGLSQLHQLRGRVGRGNHPSHFLLVASSALTAAATKRLRVLEKTNNGFRIAEQDLRLRGPGDMIGVRQTGIPVFRIGNPLEDIDLMALARRIAEEAISSATEDELSRAKDVAQARWGDKLGFAEVL